MNMEQTKVIEAARLLSEARLTGKPINELPQDIRPVVAADSNAIAKEVTKILNEQIGGWKITFLYKPREVPFQCHLFSSRIFASPAEISASLTPSLCIEPEITFRLLADLPARAKLYHAEEVAEVVEACPSMEVVDTRFDTKHRSIRQRLNERATLVEAYADHITNGAFVVGKGIKDWRDVDFGAMRVRMTADGKTLVETVGGHAFVDPFLPVVVLANQLRRGPGMKTGQVVATGSFSGFFPVEIDQEIVAEFDGVGKATARFVR
jgi:2-keto-4-pentenoate hydratase